MVDPYYGSSPLPQACLARARKAARPPWSTLVQGERGTGKSILVRQIHDLSGRTGGFIRCPGLSLGDTMLQGEMLGHVRGAFTDAKNDQKGFIELAHDGTLFLDEIESASYAFQTFLVGQIEDREVRRIGDARYRRVNVRFIAASNADLPSLVASGRFRADLLDRLSRLVIHLPPLREYPEAIIPLAHTYLREAWLDLQCDFQPRLTNEVVKALREFPWPGNLRQLAEACCQIAFNIDEDRPMVLSDLPPWLFSGPALVADRSGPPELHKQVLAALQATHGNKSEAARMLNMTRQRFLRILKRIGESQNNDGRAQEA